MKKLLNHVYAFIQTERVKKQLKRYCEVEYKQNDAYPQYTKLVNDYYNSIVVRGFI